MSYLANGIQRLRNAFSEHNLFLNLKSDHVVIESSHNQTEEKIISIVESAGFCPVLATPPLHAGNFVFTVTPYKLPDFFSLSSISSPKMQIVRTPSQKNPYFGMEEITHLIKHALFFEKSNVDTIIDKSDSINSFRAYVSKALTECLLTLLSKNYGHKDNAPIIEIGSRHGYTLPESYLPKTIRIQSQESEIQLLKKSSTGPAYLMTMENLYNCLIDTQKKIPLFFGLNVFDEWFHEERMKYLSCISELQNSGDRILIMLDSNPAVDVIVRQLETTIPDHVALPYYLPTPDHSSSLSLIVVPKRIFPTIPNEQQFLEIIQQESHASSEGRISPFQLSLQQLQKKYNLRVISLEDFFILQIKCELEEAGYNANVRFHASFTTGPLPESISSLKQDLIYKSLTDIATCRQWDPTDLNFQIMLNKKGLKLPENFTPAFLADLKKNGHKIFGAEILVIEATKK